MEQSIHPQAPNTKTEGLHESAGNGIQVNLRVAYGFFYKQTL